MRFIFHHDTRCSRNIQSCNTRFTFLSDMACCLLLESPVSDKFSDNSATELCRIARSSRCGGVALCKLRFARQFHYEKSDIPPHAPSSIFGEQSFEWGCWRLRLSLSKLCKENKLVDDILKVGTTWSWVLSFPCFRKCNKVNLKYCQIQEGISLDFTNICRNLTALLF